MGRSDTIELESFNTRIRNGEMLVILDDMVLNIDTYVSNHPGGEKVLQQNIGRDVSRYFHGGYSYSLRS